jgi:putative ABC transport system permease protein
VNELRRAVASVDRDVPIFRVRTMEAMMGAAANERRLSMVLLASFAGLALLLAAVGTYGVLSYLVTERRQEIGIRMALGADAGRILRLVLARGLTLSALGLAIGLAASLGLSRVLGALLFNVAAFDPRTLAAVAVVIAVSAATACVIPALRATRVDPLVVLRE